MGSVVLLHALLKGMGREVECEVLAHKLPAVGSGPTLPMHVYSGCSILTAPRDLPDGEYAIQLESQILPALLYRGVWL